MILSNDNRSIKSNDSIATVLRVKLGFTNDKGEIYDKNGVFIDFPRELGHKTRANLDIASITKRFNHKTVVCLVHERTNYSYYHWTYETLPKLIYLSNHKKEIKADKIYFHYGWLGHPYQRQALRNLGFKYWQILDASIIKSLMAKEILVVKLKNRRLEPSIELCQTIKSTFIKRPTTRPFRKIYLTRDHVQTGRKVINEFQLRDLLESYGFETVIADKLNLKTQTKLFNESKYIISPHGAALANIVFCEAGAKIIELFNQKDKSTWNPLYGKIAKTCGLELIPVAPKEIKNNETHHRSDFYVNLEEINNILLDWRL